MRTKEIIIKTSFFIYLFAAIIATFFRIYDLAGGIVIIYIWGLLDIIFIIISISEIVNIKKITITEKNMWITGLITITPIAGLIYILSARKRIMKR